MPTTASSRNIPDKAADATAYKQLLTDIEMLDPTSWKADAILVDGDLSISRLSRRFRLNEREAVDGFRDFFQCTSNEHLLN
jgi:hypothetical protein